MEPSYYGASRSSLMGRRMNSESAPNDTGRVGRYDRNRFAKLELGKAEPSILDSVKAGISLFDNSKPPVYENGRPGLYEPARHNLGRTDALESIRAGLYDSGRAGAYDSGRPGLYESGRVGQYESRPTGNSETGRAGLYSRRKYDSGPERHEGLRLNENGGRFDIFNGGGILNDNIGITQSLNTRTYDDISRGYVPAYDLDGGNEHEDLQVESHQRNGISLLDEEEEFVSHDDSVIYYRIIDNYTIWKLEIVEPSSTCNSSRAVTPTPTPPMTPSALIKPFPLMSLKSGDVPIHKKSNLIKNLQALIEELQQKVTRLQLEVEDQDISQSFCNSKFGKSDSSVLSSPSSSSSLCSSNSGTCETRPPTTGDQSSVTTASVCDVSCRHLRELELIKKLNEALQSEKFHLEEQIVQLRSVKSIVHGTDSEKTVTKLEAENLQLQNQLKETQEKLRQISNSSSFSSTDHPEMSQVENFGQSYNGVDSSVLSHTKAESQDTAAKKIQQYASNREEMEARINNVVQRLKEKHNIVGDVGKGGDAVQGNTKMSAAATDAEIRRSRRTMTDRLKGVTSEVQQLAGDLMDIKFKYSTLQSWMAGQVQNLMLQMKQMLRSMGGSVETQEPLVSLQEAMDAYSCLLTSRERESVNKLKDLDAQLQSISVQNDKKKNKKTEEDREEHKKGDKAIRDGEYEPWNRETEPGREIIEQRKNSKTAEGRDGAIRVTCRIRPKLKDEDGESVLSSSADSTTVHLLYRGRNKTFDVDQIFSSNDTQETIFNELKSQITLGLDGNNVNIIAYGETGSGKTFTIQGSSDNLGMLQRITAELREETQKRQDTVDYKLSMSILEIYNESLRDLLGNDINAKIDTKPNADGGINIQGLTLLELRPGSDVNEILKRSQENRLLGPGRANDHSSRSHLVITLALTGFNKNDNTRINGKVVLVDLAGSERIEKTSDPIRYKEAQSINKTLTCLGDVLYALLAKQTHVPYRSSKLTHVLQDSLGSKTSSTSLIVHMSPAEKRASETMSSLMFAQRVRSVEPSSTTTTTTTGKGQGGSSEGGSGSRTPVEPMNQRPRRPSTSTSTVSDRMTVFTSERRPSVSNASDKKGPTTPGTVKKSNTGSNLKLNTVRDKSTESKNDGRMTTTTPPATRPKPSLKLFTPAPRR